MKNQQVHWNQLHAQGDFDHYSGKPTAFVEEVLGIISNNSTILELGCGAGNDSFGFAAAGHTVLATDFSDVAITKNEQRYKDLPNLHFKVLDISLPFLFPDSEFDVVYSRLALHYFTDTITKQIFDNIFRVLKPQGYLCFICKSVDDPLYGKGTQLEKNMFELDGHVRHFFDIDYVTALLQNKFLIKDIEHGQESFYGSTSAFIKVIAQKLYD
jgi:ubiquinone/menaquinone biosynthesis C-methylase UbiE